MRLTLLGFLFLFISAMAFGSPAGPAPARLFSDTSTNIKSRKFDGETLQRYRQQPAFNYHEETSGPSLWDRFWRWFWKWIDSWFNKNPKTTNRFMVGLFIFLKYLFIIGGGGALVLLILKLAGINPNIFRKKSSAIVPYSEFFEDINAIDFEQEIEKAIGQQNYRFAVRLLYLQSLKKLSDRGLIDWQINKTNSAYVTELSNTLQQSTFKKLTLQFEYVWYGEFVLSKNVFERINALFNDFNRGVL
jgi:hypothetical protein